MFIKKCEYCGCEFHADEHDDEQSDYCSERHKELDEDYRRCEAAADEKFEEMAYGPPDKDVYVPYVYGIGPWEQEQEY